MTHGPRMNANGRPPPTTSGPIRTGFTDLILSIRDSRFGVRAQGSDSGSDVAFGSRLTPKDTRGTKQDEITVCVFFVPCVVDRHALQSRTVARRHRHIRRRKLAGLVAIARLHEARKEWVWPERLRLEFRVE